jgi:hypothetical protein
MSDTPRFTLERLTLIETGEAVVGFVDHELGRYAPFTASIWEDEELAGDVDDLNSGKTVPGIWAWDPLAWYEAPTTEEESA